MKGDFILICVIVISVPIALCRPSPHYHEHGGYPHVHDGADYHHHAEHGHHNYDVADSATDGDHSDGHEVRYHPGRPQENGYGRQVIRRNRGPPKPLKYRVERKGDNKVKVCPKHSRCMFQHYNVNKFNVREN